MTPPTAAQLRYLRNALAVMVAGTGKGNCFTLTGPGSEGTGCSCLGEEWIIECLTITYRIRLTRRIHRYRVTPAGRAIVEAVG